MRTHLHGGKTERETDFAWASPDEQDRSGLVILRVRSPSGCRSGLVRVSSLIRAFPGRDTFLLNGMSRSPYCALKNPVIVLYPIICRILRGGRFFSSIATRNEIT